MRIDLYSAGIHLGSVQRGGAHTVYAYTPDGTALGSFGDLDAAAAALARRLPVAA